MGVWIPGRGMFIEKVMFEERLESGESPCAYLVEMPSRQKEQLMENPLVGLWLLC